MTIFTEILMQARLAIAHSKLNLQKIILHIKFSWYSFSWFKASGFETNSN